MAGENIGGRVSVVVDGDTIPLGDAVTFRLGGENRTTQSGVDGQHDYSVEHVPGMVQATVKNTSALDIQAINDADDVEVQVETAGDSYVWETMWLTEQLEVDAVAGTAQATFEGQPGRMV